MPPKKAKSNKSKASSNQSILSFVKSPSKADENKAESNDTNQPKKRIRKEKDMPGTPEPEVLSEEENDDVSKKETKVLEESVPLPKLPKLTEKDLETLNFDEIDSKPHLLGAHVSISGGVHKALMEARLMRGSSCAFFLRPPRNFNVKPLTSEAIAEWKKTAEKLKFNLNNIVVHAPYILNFGSPNGEALEKSRRVLCDDLQRCDQLGIKYYNVHPGSTLKQISAEKCCNMIAESINTGLDKTKNVVVLLENMAGQGNWVGSNLKELGMIISQVKNKDRIGVCLDTCHAFAYGYGLNTSTGLKRLLDDFDKHVGKQYLKAMHVNDSKGACGDNRDRHEDIGKGVIGKSGFKLFMNEPLFRGIPLILETPTGIYDKEIQLLHSYVKGNSNN